VNEVDFVWEGGSPREGIAQDGFGARVSGIFTVPRTGRYEITASTDDGTRLYVDRRLMVDAWIPQSETPNVVSLDWNEGEEHLVEMEYFEAGGTATMRLSCLFEGEDGEDETLDDVNLFTGEHMRVSDGWLDLATRPVLEMSEAGEGGLRVRLFEEGGTFSLEMSRDLMNWIPVSEGTNGFYEVVPRSQGTFFRIKE